MQILLTSLCEIQSFNPCKDGWERIQAARAGKPFSELFPIIDYLESCTFGDVCWLLGKRKKEISICVEAAKACAESVAHLSEDIFASEAAAAAAAARAADPTYASYAADPTYASYAAYAADAAARQKQEQKNKEFLREAIRAFELSAGEGK